MELHTLKSAPGATKKRKRVGRGPGSGNGKTAGKGHKGQQSRTGYSRRIGFEGGQTPLHRRLPKRGFHHGTRRPVGLINLDTLDACFKDGDTVTSEVLVNEGFAQALSGGIKVLGRGEITKKLTVKVEAISASAKTKVEAAGGTVELVSAVKAADPQKTESAPAEAPKGDEE